MARTLSMHPMSNRQKLRLPSIKTVDDYRAVYQRDELWLPVIQAVAQKHGLEPDLRREVQGTHVVYRAEKAVVKLFCPLWSQDYESERVALKQSSGLPVPSILAEGTHEGWPYLIMGRVHGEPAGNTWPKLTLEQRRDVVTQIGYFLRHLHEQDVPEEFENKWQAFISERQQRAEEHHNMPEPWLSWIRERVLAFHEPEVDRHALINGDITADHVLLVKEDQGHWRLSGVIDFGDARIGHPYYDFVAPLAFYCFGEPGLSHSLLKGYGLEATPELKDALTTYCLLHEFGRLQQLLDKHPVDTPREFERALWG